MQQTTVIASDIQDDTREAYVAPTFQRLDVEHTHTGSNLAPTDGTTVLS